MKWEREDAAGYLADYLARRPPRTEGTHLTAVIDFIEAKLNLAPRFMGSSSDTWQHSARVGFMVEDMLADQVLANLYPSFVHGLEIVVDGIIMSPDGLLEDADGDNVLWEGKATWRSLRTSPPEANNRWLMQVKGYCRALGINRCLLIGLYLCGDYQPPAPQIIATRFEFTSLELEQNWQSILSAKKEMEKVGLI